jgi:magnesium-transporting ATPase (P-type)
MRFLKQFDNILIYALLVSAVITAALAHWVDAGVIFVVVFINAIIGYIQEGKAEKALDAIRTMLVFESSVTRDGKRVSVSAQYLVPGDIVLIEPGDKIPADLRWISIKDLRVDESLLTGESVAVEKTTNPVSPDASLADRDCMGYAGTFAVSGRGTGVVVETGSRTEVGKISEMVSSVQALQTPLLKKIGQFGRQLTFTILAISVIVFLFGIFVRSYGIQDMFLAGVGLAVAAIPEGLPAIITITLAIGVHRMARRHAIIRRLPAVEALGSVTVICTDKTGTLTRNEMTVITLITADSTLTVTGSGYDPHGQILSDSSPIEPDDSVLLNEIARAAILCNDASIHQHSDGLKISGDPMEAALIVFGQKCGLDNHKLFEQWPRLDVIPFESENRFMATLNHDHASRRRIYLKGAPEAIVKMCGYEFGGDFTRPVNTRYWEQAVMEIAKNGQRALALAYKDVPAGKQDLIMDDIKSEMVLLGITGIIDPPRTEAIDSVRKCHQAGIKVKMITGDNAITARAIGASIGLGQNAISGEQLQKLNPADFDSAAAHTDVFGRVSPEHKLNLVRSLQARGEVVAMTGDGVNDAPALKQADIGVAMGLKGTEVAKEAAEIVLADDNFASITSAVEEGRTVYDNIQKSILFLLPTNVSQAGIIVLAIFLGYVLPITPVQILWVNMVTAITLALALAFEPSESDVMKKPPRDPDEPILTGFVIWRLVFVSLFIIIGTFSLFRWEQLRDADINAARTVAVNTLVMFEVFYLFNARFLTKSALSFNGLFGNKYVLISVAAIIILQLMFTYTAPMQSLFATVSIGWDEWLRIVLVSVSVFVVVEIEKIFFRRFHK